MKTGSTWHKRLLSLRFSQKRGTGASEHMLRSRGSAWASSPVILVIEWPYPAGQTDPCGQHRLCYNLVLALSGALCPGPSKLDEARHF